MSAPRPTPAQALERSRVDLVGIIRDGIPEREYVPGADGLLPRAKRVHIAAERKTGKSLSIAVVTAVQIVAAGGTVVVLDRENGADEYARRLRDVLDARDVDRERVREHLRYHAWPALRLDWGEGYAAAFAGADVVIFDSSRSHLTPLGLKEDQSDDFAAFTDALIDPLMQAGIATVILDNAGHQEKDRPRGTSSKGDLCVHRVHDEHALRSAPRLAWPARAALHRLAHRRDHTRRGVAPGARRRPLWRVAADRRPPARGAGRAARRGRRGAARCRRQGAGIGEGRQGDPGPRGQHADVLRSVPPRWTRRVGR